MADPTIRLTFDWERSLRGLYQPKKYAVTGYGYSGDYDTLEEAREIVLRNGNGRVYVAIDCEEDDNGRDKGLHRESDRRERDTGTEAEEAR